MLYYIHLHPGQEHDYGELTTILTLCLCTKQETVSLPESPLCFPPSEVFVNFFKYPQMRNKYNNNNNNTELKIKPRTQGQLL